MDQQNAPKEAHDAEYKAGRDWDTATGLAQGADVARQERGEGTGVSGKAQAALAGMEPLPRKAQQDWSCHP